MTTPTPRRARARLARFALSLAGACSAAAITACGSTEGVTRGWGMELRVADPPKNQFVFYSLTRDGVVTYIAGRSAMRTEPGQSEKPTYRANVTRDEADALVRTLEESDRIETAEAAEGEAAYTLAVQPPGRLGWRIRSGETAYLRRLRDEAARLVESKRALTPVPE